jgi:hypothetical protein
MVRRPLGSRRTEGGWSSQGSFLLRSTGGRSSRPAPLLQLFSEEQGSPLQICNPGDISNSVGVADNKAQPAFFSCRPPRLVVLRFSVRDYFDFNSLSP